MDVRMRTSFYKFASWKMATANPLEDLLNSVVDENAISALVGSLESQLASPTAKDPPQQNSTGSVNNNHIDGGRVGGTVPSQHTQLQQAAGQQPGLIQSHSQIIVNSINGNKNSVSQPHLLAANSVGAASVAPACITSTVSHLSAVNSSHPSLPSVSSSAAGPNVKFTTVTNSALKSEPHIPNTVSGTQKVIVTVGSTNTGTVVLGTNSTCINSVPLQGDLLANSVNASGASNVAGSAIYNLASVAAEQQPLTVPSQVKLPVSSSAGRLTVREQLEKQQQKDIKPPVPTVNMNLVTASNAAKQPSFVIKQEQQTQMKPQVHVKQEVKVLQQGQTQPASSAAHQTVNIVTSTGAVRMTTLPVNSTSVITLSKPSVSNPQTVTVVRPPISSGAQSSLPIQIVNANTGPRGSTGMMQPKALAPRVINTPIRIAAAPHQQAHQVVSRTQGNVGPTITLPPGFQLPPGTVLVKNEQGQIMVLSQGQQGQQLPNTSNLPGSATYKLQTVKVGGGPGTPPPAPSQQHHHQPHQSMPLHHPHGGPGHPPQLPRPPGHQGAHPHAPMSRLPHGPGPHLPGQPSPQLNSVHAHQQLHPKKKFVQRSHLHPGTVASPMTNVSAGGHSVVSVSSAHSQPGNITAVPMRHPGTAVTTTVVPPNHSAGMPRPGIRIPLPHPASQVSTQGQPPVHLAAASQPQVMVSSTVPHSVSSGPIGPAVASTMAVNQNTMENVRKCKNFLSTLIKLASGQPANTVRNVKDLIQGLIDGKIEPEAFTAQLQVELKSSPQPYLVPFLKKSLPMLRQSLLQNTMKIEGVRPPKLTAGHPLVSIGAPSSGTGVTTHPAVGGPRPTFTQIQPPGGAKVLPGMRQITPQMMQVIRQQVGPPGVKMNLANQTRSLLQQGSAKPSVMPTTVTALQSHMSKQVPSAALHKEKRKFDSTLKDDDDINDVATMGGVNLTEESRNILATNSELMSGQLRSCKDETFLTSAPLLARINAIARKHGLDDVLPGAANLISHATQERLRNVVERLAIISEHRLEIYKSEPKYEVTNEVKSQLKFLEELDRLEKKRHEEAEREILLRAAKSRSKHEDPEQLKLKEKAKALQQAEMEEMRQREANLTALAAIGPRKKRKLEDTTQQSGSAATGGSGAGTNSPRTSMLRPRIKRVNLRDLIFLLEQERETSHSNLLYRSFLK